GGPTAELGSIETMLGGRQLILGVDRLDYSKGIPERLEAFARMLEKFPEWRGRVSFVQVSVPTRSDVPDYAELRARVELLVGRMADAVVTNPYHVDGVAADLDRALRCERAERVAAHRALARVVYEDTAAAWAQRFRALLHR